MRRRAGLAAVLSVWALACGGEVTGERQATEPGPPGASVPGDAGVAPPPGACDPGRSLSGEIIVGNDTYRWGGVPAAAGAGVAIAELEGVTVIDGSLAIVGTDLESLAPLSCLREITGALHLGSLPFCMTEACFGFPNSRLTTLAGLEGLRSVGSQLVIAMSPLLEDIDALAGLGEATSLHVTGLDSLKTLRGLSGLTRLSDVQITGNLALASLEGLEGFTELSRLYLSGNAALENVDTLAGITWIEGQVTLSDNPALSSIAGLQNLRSIGGGLSITGNGRLDSLAGLAALGSVSGKLRIEECPVKSLAGLSALTSAGGLHIVGTPALESLAGLEALRDLGDGALELRETPRLADLSALAALGGGVSELLVVGPSALPDLHGLDSISAVKGELRVSGHPELQSLVSLARLASAGGVRIYGNPRLPTCAAEALAAGLTERCEDPADPLEGVCTGLCDCPGNDGSGTCP